MIEYLVFTLLGILFCRILFYLLYPPLTKELSGLKGPPRIPILGNILTQLRFTKPEEGWGFQIDSCAKYPSPMLQQNGPQYLVSMYDAHQIEGLMKSSVNIDKSWIYSLIELWLGSGLLISTGSRWQRKRKMLTPAFHFNILKDFVPIFNEQSQTLVEILNEKSTDGQPIDVCQLVTRCTLDIICESAMGKKLNSQRTDSDYVAAIYRFGDITIRRMFRPWQWYNTIMFLTPSGQELRSCINTLHSFTKTVIAEREKTFEPPQMDNDSSVLKPKRRLAFLDLLLNMKREGTTTEEEIREEVDTFMFEGHDTTSSGISSTLYMIGRYPDVQEKVFQELESILGTDPTTSISTDDANKMVYLECVIKETLRLLPPVPIISRQVKESFTIPGGQIIPKGTQVDIVIEQLHRDPKHFPDPFKFDPDRFSPENSKGRHPFAFIPFSAGPRNCIGQKFALLEEKIVLASILRNFRLESTQSFDELKTAMQLVLRAMGGIWIRFHRRKMDNDL